MWMFEHYRDIDNKYEFLKPQYSNIYDINNIDFSDIEIKRKNISELSEKVKNGYFTEKAINKALEVLGAKGKNNEYR